MKRTIKEEMKMVRNHLSESEKSDLQLALNQSQELWDDYLSEEDCADELLGSFDFQF